MNIGSVTSSSFSFSRQNLKNNGSSSSTASTKSTSNTTKQAPGPAGGLPPGGLHGAPPKELSKSDLEQIKSKISRTDSEGASKIDNLIQNFDQYDNGTGKISIDQFKSYAQQNAISLPEPKQPPAGYQELKGTVPILVEIQEIGTVPFKFSTFHQKKPEII